MDRIHTDVVRLERGHIETGEEEEDAAPLGEHIHNLYHLGPSRAATVAPTAT